MRDIQHLPAEVIQRRIERLKRKMKSCNHTRMKERYQTIYLYLQGYSKETISQITGRALSTVYRYINLYVQAGLKGLRMRHSPGRPAFLSQEQCQQVYNMVANHFLKMPVFRSK
jgi:transposase